MSVLSLLVIAMVKSYSFTPPWRGWCVNDWWKMIVVNNMSEMNLLIASLQG